MTRPLLHALLALFVITAGCSGLGMDHTRNERAVEALDNASDAISSTSSYRFDSNMTITAPTDSRTEQVNADLTGVVNTSSRKMRSKATIDNDSRRSFVLNRTTYRECGEPWDGWEVEELDEDTEWATQTPAVRQLSLLKSGPLYWNGTETLDGKRAIVITGSPPAESITQYRDGQSKPLLGGPNVENTELRVWLSVETGRPLRTELKFTVSKGDNKAMAMMTTTFDGYEKPVSVDLPAGAQKNQYELGCPGE